MKTANKILGFLLVSVFISLQALAWGHVGHEMVALIAQKHIGDTTRVNLAKLLGSSASLAPLGTYPDEMRSNETFDIFKPLHFVEIKTDDEARALKIPMVFNSTKSANSIQDFMSKVFLGKYQLTKDGKAGGLDPAEMAAIPFVQELARSFNYLVFTNPYGENLGVLNALRAIESLEYFLKNKNPNREQQKFALSYLVHIIGDIHQPLHVGNGTDRGANVCLVKWRSKDKNAYGTMNLHAVWDDELVTDRQCSGSPCSSVQYSELLESQNSVFPVSGNHNDWALESAALREQVYPVVTDGSGNPLRIGNRKPGRPYCPPADNFKEKIEPEYIPSLDDKYVHDFQPIMEQQIYKAGIRLAAVLDQYFGAGFTLGSDTSNKLPKPSEKPHLAHD